MIILIRLRQLINFVTLIISFILKRIHIRVKRRAWLISIRISFHLRHICQSLPLYTTFKLTITFSFKIAILRGFFTSMVIDNHELSLVSVQVNILIRGTILWNVLVFIVYIHILLNNLFFSFELLIILTFYATFKLRKLSFTDIILTAILKFIYN